MWIPEPSRRYSCSRNVIKSVVLNAGWYGRGIRHQCRCWVWATLPREGRSFREMPLELLEDRGGAGLRFGILLPHGSHQEASQSLPLLLRQMDAQDPAGPSQQGMRIRRNRAYGELTHR